MSKLITLGALATGYVLGSRAGRERYDQIKVQANRLRNSPNVQKAASDAEDLVKEKAPVAKDKVAAASRKAKRPATSSSGDGAHEHTLAAHAADVSRNGAA